jgi:hypothetical protein
LGKRFLLWTSRHPNNTNLNMYKLIIILLFLLPATSGFALSSTIKIKKNQVPLHLKVDSSKLTVRHLDTAAINKYRSDPAFNYVVKKASMNWWDRFWIWVWELWDSFWQWVGHIIAGLFGHFHLGRHAGSVIEFILIGLAVVFIVYFILLLIGIDFLKLFKKKQASIEIPYTESLENIHQINFEEAIDNAISVKDYRLAVRLLYLRSLRQLSEAGLINWKIEKTNNAYLNELKDEEQRRRFSIVTRQFEYVWYGDFPVDGNSFSNINAFFLEFKNYLP